MTWNIFIFCVACAFNVFLFINVAVLAYRLTKVLKVLNSLMHYECKNCFAVFISAKEEKYCDDCSSHREH